MKQLIEKRYGTFKKLLKIISVPESIVVKDASTSEYQLDPKDDWTPIVFHWYAHSLVLLPWKLDWS